jgi:hypothetical protein
MPKQKSRALGGGRKPQGEFARLGRPISVRMPDEMRKELERAAAESGRSVTQELLRRVQNSFYRDRERERDPALYGLLYLIGQIAEHISQVALMSPNHRGSLGSRWRTDRFMFQAFKAAVEFLLNVLEEPRGKLAPESPIPADLIKKQADFFANDPVLVKLAKNQNKSPEALGQITATELWIRASPLRIEANERALQQIKEELPEFAGAWGREIYGLAQARRALELAKKSDSKS